MFRNFAGEMLECRAAIWLRPLGTVAGLWTFAGLVGLVTVGIGTFDVATDVPRLALLGSAAWIAYWLHKSSGNNENDEPTRRERWLFNLAWGLILAAVIGL